MLSLGRAGVLAHDSALVLDMRTMSARATGVINQGNESNAMNHPTTFSAIASFQIVQARWVATPGPGHAIL